MRVLITGPTGLIGTALQKRFKEKGWDMLLATRHEPKKEGEARRAEDTGIRTVLLRTGIVLSKDGGALGTMLLPFKLGVGGVVGSGKQWMSWISLDDHVRVIEFAIENESIRGAVNSVTPH